MASITNVTGTVQTGQTLTITGTDLLNRDKTNWDSDYATDEEIFAGASVSADNWLGNGFGYTSSVKLIGSQSVAWSGSGRTAQGSDLYRVNASTTPYSGTSMFQSCYLRMDFDVGDGGWVWSSDKIMAWYQGSADRNFNWRANDGAAYDELGLQPSITDGFTWVSIPTIEQRRWYHLETEIPNESPYTWRIWLDGDLVLELTDDEDPGQSPNYCSYEVNTHCGDRSECDTFAFDKWMDECIISSSRMYPACKVEIGNNSDYATATKVYQPPTLISNTSVEVSCDLTGLGAGPYYIWVTNGRNTRSTVWSLSGLTPPKATVSFVGYAPTLAAAPQTATPTKGGITFTGYAPTATIPVEQGQVIYFTEGFEDQNFSTRGWFDHDGDVAMGNELDSVTYSPNGGASSLNIHWDAAEQQPFGSMRHNFTPTESVYIGVDIKLGDSGTTWEGSTLEYHPHVIYLLTDADGEFAGLARSSLTFYIEPHAFSARMGMQDALRIFVGGQYPVLGAVNEPTPPTGLLGTSSSHAVGGGNGNQFAVSAFDCFDVGGGDYTNSHFWDAPTIFTNDTWHRWEIFAKMNTVGTVPNADGILKVWVDGNLVWDLSNLYFKNNDYPTQKFRQLIIGPFLVENTIGGDNGSRIAQDMWLDNMMVANLRKPGRVETEGFRIRRDDGTEASATWIRGQDELTVIQSDTNFRVRAVVDNKTGSNSVHKYRLEFKLITDSAWTAVGTSGAIQLSASANIDNDRTLTTSQLDSPPNKTTSDFQEGKAWDSENGASSISIGTGKYTELEWCVTAPSASTTPLDRYQFRVTKS